MRPPTVWHPFHTWMASVIGKHMFVLMYNHEHWVRLLPLSWWKWLCGVYDWVCAIERKTKRARGRKCDGERASTPCWLHSITFLIIQREHKSLSVRNQSHKSVARYHLRLLYHHLTFHRLLFGCYTGSEAGNIVIIQEAWRLALALPLWLGASGCVPRSPGQEGAREKKKKKRSRGGNLKDLQI